MSYRKNDEFRHAEAKIFALSLAQVGIIAGLGIGAVGISTGLLLHDGSSINMKIAALISILIFLSSMGILGLMVVVYHWILSQEMSNGILAAESQNIDGRENNRTSENEKEVFSGDSFQQGARFLSEYLQENADNAASKIVNFCLLAMIFAFLIPLVGVIKISFLG